MMYCMIAGNLLSQFAGGLTNPLLAQLGDKLNKKGSHDPGQPPMTGKGGIIFSRGGGSSICDELSPIFSVAPLGLFHFSS